LVAALQVSAWALPTVAVREFSGPGAARVRAGVVAALAGKARVRSAASADAVIEGEVAKKGRRWKVTLTVREAISGRQVDQVTFMLSRPALGRGTKKRVGKKLAALIREAAANGVVAKAGRRRGKDGSAPAGDSAARFANESPAAGGAEAAKNEASDDTARAGKPAPDESAAQPSEEKVAQTEESTTVQKPAATPAPAKDTGETAMAEATGHEVIELDAGIGFQARTFSATGLGVLPTYNSSLYPSAYVSGALYPLAPLTRRALGGLGVFGRFDRAVGLKSQVKSTMQEFDTVAQRWEVGLLWRLHFGGATGLTVRPAFLYGQQQFDIGGTTVMPNTDYTYLGGGLDLDLPLLTPAFALIGGGAYEDIRSLGPAGQFGEHNDAYGLAFNGGIRLGLPWHLQILALFEELIRHADFTGTSPTGMTAQKTQDEWIGGRVTLGLTY